ncbi:uncharacterized protein BXZ73DRAFT_81772 [Epithele typhae]|uniref:uncharacterized protein n=1 Tax=Epithele typhae TaxID=378194 RepID=UPI0020078A86|nr:uncharacterized protein BXZ73DRAFT_81772 [Epithele typhae]KAH9913966.1 hypothetical protein BXZ73DRAFT_81772 [Epithele typhae]
MRTTRLRTEESSPHLIASSDTRTTNPEATPQKSEGQFKRNPTVDSYLARLERILPDLRAHRKYWGTFTPWDPDMCDGGFARLRRLCDHPDVECIYHSFKVRDWFDEHKWNAHHRRCASKSNAQLASVKVANDLWLPEQEEEVRREQAEDMKERLRYLRKVVSKETEGEKARRRHLDDLREASEKLKSMEDSIRDHRLRIQSCLAGAQAGAPPDHHRDEELRALELLAMEQFGARVLASKFFTVRSPSHPSSDVVSSDTAGPQAASGSTEAPSTPAPPRAATPSSPTPTRLVTPTAAPNPAPMRRFTRQTRENVPPATRAALATAAAAALSSPPRTRGRKRAAPDDLTQNPPPSCADEGGLRRSKRRRISTRRP